MTNNLNNHGVLCNGSGNFVNSFNNNITQITNAEGDDVELDRLLDGSISKDALHNTLNSPTECYDGTRKTVRKEIREWIDDSISPLLWLNGPAGVGKSVIAKTVAGSHDNIVATFFFSTSSDRSGATIFPTLAWQLARNIPNTKQNIIASLKNHGSLLTSEFEEQLEQLIAQPLKKCRMAFISLPVMVIDGIDECTDEHMLLRFLQVLARAAESGDMPLRFIICSRPEARIRAILEKPQNDEQEIKRQSSVPHSLQRPSIYQPRIWRIWIQSLFADISARLYTTVIWVSRNPTLLLQDIRKLYRPVQLGVDPGGSTPEIRDDLFDKISPHPVISHIQIGFSKECKEDIARYLTDQFNAAGHRLGEDVSHLVGRSCGQFLYASTIVRLLEDFDPKDVLEMARNSSLPTPNLNELYKVILKRAEDAIRKRTREGGPDCETELKVLTDVLAILIVFAENVHFFDMRENFAVIESLNGINKGRLTKKLCKMHSVLNVVPGRSISVYHRSFLEFLQSRERSGRYYVAYPKALRRFLVLLSRAGLRYFIMDWGGQLSDDDRKIRQGVENMALASRRTYFKRSSSPVTLITFHDLFHYSLPFAIFLVPFCRFMRQLKESSSAWAFILECLFLTFFCLFILSSGSFIISLTIYTLFISHSLILPLFHPFLHLHFVTIVGVLLSSWQGFSQQPLLPQEEPQGSLPATNIAHSMPLLHDQHAVQVRFNLRGMTPGNLSTAHQALQTAIVNVVAASERIATPASSDVDGIPEYFDHQSPTQHPPHPTMEVLQASSLSSQWGPQGPPPHATISVHSPSSSLRGLDFGTIRQATTPMFCREFDGNCVYWRCNFDGCQYISPTKRDMQRHCSSLRHGRRQPRLKCELCGNEFVRRDSLRRHAMRHTLMPSQQAQ